MARTIHRLSPARVRTAPIGMHCDGAGLWLHVSDGVHGPTRSWIFRFTMDGRARQMGLGPVHTVSLAEARDAARACRQQYLLGTDPIEARLASRAQARLASTKSMTFDQCAAAFIATREDGWRNEVHREQWRTSIATYVSPILGALPVSAIDRELVLKVLDPIWSTRTETASRLRGRIESILDWAQQRGLRTGENPARWKGGLEHIYARRSKLQPTRHHRAMPYAEVPGFMATLRTANTIAARALEFLILTAARAGEVRFATWPEIDLEAGLWVIPGSRMKAGATHRVPLSNRAIEILEAVKAISSSEYVFPGLAGPLSSMVMRETMQRIRDDGITIHGMRSAFSTWANEQTNYAREVVEQSLAHTIGNAVERAYARTDLLERRRKLMAEWNKFCCTEAPAVGNKVINMNSRIPA